MAKDARQRRESGNKYALMGAIGTAMTAGSAWYDKEQVRKAQELKDQQLLELKRGELSLGREKLDASNKLGQERNRIAEMQAQAQADSVANIQSRHESTQKKASVGTFLTTDFEKWKTNYVGDDDDAKMRSKAWGAVLSNGLEAYTDEQLEEISAKINEQFGVGSTGKPLLSVTEIKDGVAQLRTYAKLRGLDVNDVTDDDIRSLLSSSFTMGAEEVVPEAGAPGAGIPGEQEAGPDGVFGMGLSDATTGAAGGIMDTLRGFPAPPPEPPPQEVTDLGFDRGITQVQSQGGAMGEWWLQLDPQDVAAMPDDALPPEAIAWLQEQGLR